MLIDHGPDRIEWFGEVETSDAYGTPVRGPSPTPTDSFFVEVQRSTSEDAALLGQDPSEVYSFRTSRDLSGAKSAVTVNGRPAEVLGPPLRQGRSSRTASTVVYLHFTSPAGA